MKKQKSGHRGRSGHRAPETVSSKLANKPGRRSPTRDLKVENRNKPVLLITGIVAASVAAIVGWAVVETPDESVVDVERASYATREECIADWNNPADCQQVQDDSSSDSAQDWSDTQITALLDASDAGSPASSSSGAHDGSYGGNRGGAWYGPYYTRSGVVYHNNGVQTNGVPASVHGSATALRLRSTSLTTASSAFSRAPRSVAMFESRAISRGGFTSGHGGEGGAHGFGGSRGG